MSGGQHNPNGRPAQLGSAWNHLQLQTPYLGRVPQAAHLSSERAGVTWHTPTPPLHPYLPAAVSPDPLQARKMTGGGGNAVYRHTPTPPDRETLHYRHTPTPPDKLFRHTPSPGDAKAGAALPPADIYPIPLQPRDKMRAEELLSYARGGVDLTLGRSNGAPLSLSVRDAPTINSLLTAAARAPRPAHARVDAILERLTPQHSPQSVIVHPRTTASPTDHTDHTDPSPPDSNEDSTDSCGPGAKRKRKPDRTVRVPASPTPPAPHAPHLPLAVHTPPVANASPSRSPPQDTNYHNAATAESNKTQPQEKPIENGEIPRVPTEAPNGPQLSHSRRKTKSGSAETIDNIAAMIASTDQTDGIVDLAPVTLRPSDSQEPLATIEILKSVLGSPDAKQDPLPPPPQPVSTPPLMAEVKKLEQNVAQIPKRRSTRSSRSDVSTSLENQPSDMNPEVSESASDTKKEETLSIVEVENALEQMFAGIEEQAPDTNPSAPKEISPKKRRKARVNRKTITGKDSRRSSAAASTDEGSAPKTKAARKKITATRGKQEAPATHKDAYDSGSNASSSRSRGPYVQVRGPRDSPLSVSVVNQTGDDEGEAAARARSSRRPRGAGHFRNGLKSRGLHCSTLSTRYDATTPDRSWVCAFCELGPHAGVKERLERPARPLGDLFGPYTVSTDCDEYRSLDETRRKWHPATETEGKDTCEVWFHEDCGLWAPGLVAAGARLQGLAEAVWGARGARCGRCGRAGAGVACAARACPARAHVNCARSARWLLHEEDFRALCPRHSAV